MHKRPRAGPPKRPVRSIQASHAAPNRVVVQRQNVRLTATSPAVPEKPHRVVVQNPRQLLPRLVAAQLQSPNKYLLFQRNNGLSENIIDARYRAKGLFSNQGRLIEAGLFLCANHLKINIMKKNP